MQTEIVGTMELMDATLRQAGVDKDLKQRHKSQGDLIGEGQRCHLPAV
ncbi:MAG: hypothetical protein QW100_04400 [Thermoplasmatales archaeon]